MTRAMRRMSALTSRRGRVQFSVEKAYSVSDLDAALAEGLDDRGGCSRCRRGARPGATGRAAFAQRPLPSMMIAT